jgi:hypothetical protein
MRLISLAIAACAFVALLGAVIILLLWLLHPDWWKKKLVRVSVMLLPAVTSISAVFWALGHQNHWTGMLQWGAFWTPTFFVMEASLLAALPFSAIIHTVIRIIDSYKRHRKNEVYSPGRRRFFKTAAAVFPAVAVPSSMAGIADSFNAIKVPIRNIPVSDLPNQLQGFKIAHLSDIHLGYYVHLDHLQEAAETIKSEEPDIVLVTGDISDDLGLLPDALEIISHISPRFGIYASVGNHEYYRGIDDVLKIFKSAPFPMLINSHINLELGGKKIFLGGADDPRYLRRDYSQFLVNTIEHTMGSASRDSFRLLMCHRPEGFNYSVSKGIDLVLSGHMHGGQIGFAGRSLLEPIFPEKYMWGIYRRGRTTLHTSAGMGHWVPFRLGVPAEAPILILENG